MPLGVAAVGLACRTLPWADLVSMLSGEALLVSCPEPSPYPGDPSQAPDSSRVQRGLQTTRAPAEEGGQTPYPSFFSARGPYAVIWSLWPGARIPPLRLC